MEWDNFVRQRMEKSDETPIDSVTQDTFQIGKFLHMTVVRLSLSNDKLLQWGQLYSYNLKFTTTDDASKDFKSLNLLDETDEWKVQH